MITSIKTGSKLKSKTTGVIVEVVDMDFNMFEWTYKIDISGVIKWYSYNTLLKEYDIVDAPIVASTTIELQCTCGGMKTYNSKDIVYHSVWCIYGK